MAAVRETFIWSGEVFTAGQEVDDKAPVVAACPDLFDRSAPAPVVEQATAAPGEKRVTPARARKAKD